MDLIALTGPQCSGKSTLALALENRGYTRIDFADQLKQAAAAALTAGVGVYTPVEGIRRDKAKYRPFLQELGTLIGFSDDPRWVEKALYEWRVNCVYYGCPLPAVFDNVRTVEQFKVLQPYGFKLVRLEADEKTRFYRARERYGIRLKEFVEQGRHPIELGLDLGQYVTVALDSTQPAEALAQTLIDLRIQDAA